MDYEEIIILIRSTGIRHLRVQKVQTALSVSKRITRYYYIPIIIISSHENVFNYRPVALFHALVFFQIYCRILHVLLQFFMVANYMWMFCEGLHLHMALVVVFVNDVSAMRWFYAIGWGLPAVLTAFYVSWRSYSQDTEQ